MRLLFLPADAEEVSQLLDAGHRPVVKQILLRPDYSELWAYLGAEREYVAIVSAYLSHHTEVRARVADLARTHLADLATMIMRAVCENRPGGVQEITLEDIGPALTPDFHPQLAGKETVAAAAPPGLPGEKL